MSHAMREGFDAILHIGGFNLKHVLLFAKYSRTKMIEACTKLLDTTFRLLAGALICLVRIPNCVLVVLKVEASTNPVIVRFKLFCERTKIIVTKHSLVLNGHFVY